MEPARATLLVDAADGDTARAMGLGPTHDVGVAKVYEAICGQEIR